MATNSPAAKAVKPKLYLVRVEVVNGGDTFKEEMLVRAKTKQGAISIATKARIVAREPSQEELLKLGGVKTPIHDGAA